MTATIDLIKQIQDARRTYVDMLQHYYNNGVVSSTDVEGYLAQVLAASSTLEYKIQTIFSVCEARLQAKDELSND
jgi:outer membrane protein TolC